MPHETALIATMSVALALAFVGGFLATRIGLPAIVGYLLAGVAVGPFTPGFVADAARVKFVAPPEPSVMSATWPRARFTVPSTALRKTSVLVSSDNTVPR